jgi:hypothetical protein
MPLQQQLPSARRRSIARRKADGSHASAMPQERPQARDGLMRGIDIGRIPVAGNRDSQGHLLQAHKGTWTASARPCRQPLAC